MHLQYSLSYTMTSCHCFYGQKKCEKGVIHDEFPHCGHIFSCLIFFFFVDGCGPSSE